MAVLTLYATNNLAGTAHQEMSEASPGADATSSPNAGWTPGTASATGNPRASFDAQTMVGSGFSGTTQPDGTPVTTAGAGDCLRSATTYNGTFATGVWTFNFACIATSSFSQAGRIAVRFLRSADATGASGVTDIGAAQFLDGTTRTVTTSQVVSIAASGSLSGFTLVDQYLFVQMAWGIYTAGTMTSSNVIMRVGATATTLVTPDFTDLTPQPIVVFPAKVQDIYY
jgi:hypothetical protein